MARANISKDINGLGLSKNQMQILLNNGMSLNSLRTNTPTLLLEEEWTAIDNQLIRIHQENLVATDDLIAAGLIRNNGGIGTLLDKYRKIEEMGEASVSMSATAGENDREKLGRETDSVPVPIIHKSFGFDIRELDAGRRIQGDSIDTTHVQAATRSVKRTLEKICFNGADVTYNGKKLYGYCNSPFTLTGSKGDWTSQKNIFTSINTAIGQLEDRGFYGGYHLYISRDYAPKFREDYDVDGRITLMERIKKLSDKIKKISFTSELPASGFVLVQMTSDVVDLSMGEDIKVIEWDNYGGMEIEFKIMTAQAPRIKGNAKGNTGIAFYS